MISAKASFPPTSASIPTCSRAARSASTPTRRSASAARRARSRARNGTTCPTTATAGRATPTTTPTPSGPRRGGTFLFVEQNRARGQQLAGPMSGDALSDLTDHEDPFRWIFLSDVCKHCENAGCLEACPTGSIIRTEVGSVLVQNDVCNGCGYCVVGCPFGVIDRRKKPLKDAGGAFKCTFCYDRQASGLVPACAKACPTESILFGPLDELHAHADEARRASEGHRLSRRAELRSGGHERRGHPRVFPVAGRAGSLRPAAQAAGADHLPESRLDQRVRHGVRGDPRGVRPPCTKTQKRKKNGVFAFSF